MLGYHFVGNELRGGSPVPEDGEWLTHEGPLELCVSGLHWSKTAFDALKYAPGNILCRVETDGETLHDPDQSVSQKRKIIERIDATELLRGFARWQAYQCLHLWDPDPVVVEFINTGNEALREKAHKSASAMARARASEWARDSAMASAIASDWDSASASARDSDWASASARDSARASAIASDWSSASASARASAWDSASDWDSASASARASARARGVREAESDFQMLVDIAFEDAK